MRAHTALRTALTLGACLNQASPVLAQGTTISDAECLGLRQRLAEHARLSEGVRRAVTAQAGAAPAAPAPAPAAPTGRAEAIRARLEQIPKDRQALEEQRLGAMMKFEISRATQIQTQIQALDQELWEETTTMVRPASYWRTDVEVTRSRETRTTSGALVGTPSVSAPTKFSLDR